MVLDWMSKGNAVDFLDLKRLIAFSDEVIIVLDEYFLGWADVYREFPTPIVENRMPWSYNKLIDFHHLNVCKNSSLHQTLYLYFVSSNQLPFLHIFQFLYVRFVIIPLIQSPNCYLALSINASTIVTIVIPHVDRCRFINDVFLFLCWRFWRFHLNEDRIHLVLIIWKQYASIQLKQWVLKVCTDLHEMGEQ